MKKSVIAFAMLVVATSVFGSSTIAYYDFKDGTPDTFVTQVKNLVDNSLYIGTAAPSSNKANNVYSPVGCQPIFSNDGPGKYIWDGRASKVLLTGNPQSVRFYPATNENNEVVANTGGFISLDGLATKISELDEGTIEFFGTVDAFDKNWCNFISFNSGNSFKISTGTNNKYLMFQNTSKSGAAYECKLEVDTVIDKWKHFAISWSKAEGKMYCYCNHQYLGEAVFTNSTQTTSRPLMIGSSTSGAGETIAGKVSCLRVSSKILTVDEMLYVSDYNIALDQIGFYNFSEGTVGEEVKTVKNTIDDTFAEGVAQTFNGGDAATFISDVPSPYILKSSLEPIIISENHKSIHFPGDTSTSSKGSAIFMTGLGSALTKLPAWTIEFFARRTASKTWRTAFSMNITDGNYCKLALPAQPVNTISVQNHQYYGHLGYELALSGSDCDTSAWNHYALTFTNNQLRVFVNYGLVSQNKLQATEYTTNWVGGVVDGDVESIITNNIYVLVDYINMTNSVVSPKWEDMILGSSSLTGSELFNGDISCFRVTQKKLDSSEFMIASFNSPANKNITSSDTTIFHWRGEGEDGEEVDCDISYPNGENYLSAHSEAAGNGSKCKYSTSAIDKNHIYVWYGDKKTKYVNKSCFTFFGYNSGNPYQAWDGTVLEHQISSNPNIHPDNWTMEAFVKANGNYGASTISHLIFGKGHDHNEYVWKLNFSNSYKQLQYIYYTKSNQNKIVNIFSDGKDFNDGKWHHLAVSYDKLTMTAKVYVDYQLEKTIVETEPIKENLLYRYRLGRYCACNGFYGWMDEIRLSNKALEPTEFIRLLPAEGLTLILR